MVSPSPSFGGTPTVTEHSISFSGVLVLRANLGKYLCRHPLETGASTQRCVHPPPPPPSLLPLPSLLPSPLLDSLELRWGVISNQNHSSVCISHHFHCIEEGEEGCRGQKIGGEERRGERNQRMRMNGGRNE